MAFCLQRIRQRREMIAWDMRRVLSVLLPSRRAQPCQYEDVRREQDGRLADLRGADPRGARGSPTRIWIDKPALSKALPCPTASCAKKGDGQKRRQARYKLSSQDIDLRFHLDRWRPRLQLPHPGELPDGGEVAPGDALQNPRLLDEVGRRASLGPIAKGLLVLGAHEDLQQRGQHPKRHYALGEQDLKGRGVLAGYLSPHGVQLGVGASSVKGSPPAAVLASMRPALRPMSEARPMTSGEEERTSRRNSRRASRSPASALSETALSSFRRFLVSSEGSSAPGSGSGTSVLSFASAVAGRYQLGPGEDPRRLRELQDRCAEGFQALQLRPLPRLALLPRLAEVGVGVGYKLRFLPGPHVPLSDPAVFALASVVVEVAPAPLPGHPLPRPSCATPRHHPRLCDGRCSEANVPVAGEGFPVESGVAAHHGAGRLARRQRPVYDVVLLVGTRPARLGAHVIAPARGISRSRRSTMLRSRCQYSSLSRAACKRSRSRAVSGMTVVAGKTQGSSHSARMRLSATNASKAVPSDTIATPPPTGLRTSSRTRDGLRASAR